MISSTVLENDNSEFWKVVYCENWDNIKGIVVDAKEIDIEHLKKKLIMQKRYLK